MCVAMAGTDFRSGHQQALAHLLAGSTLPGELCAGVMCAPQVLATASLLHMQWA